MRQLADYSLSGEGSGDASVTLSGPLNVAGVGALDARLRALAGPFATVDLSQVTAIDTVGAWIAWRLARDTGAEITGESEEAGRLIKAVSRSEGEHAIEPDRAELVERVPEAVGGLVVGIGEGTVGIIGFLGAILVTAGQLIAHPRRMRSKASCEKLPAKRIPTQTTSPPSPGRGPSACRRPWPDRLGSASASRSSGRARIACSCPRAIAAVASSDIGGASPS